MNEYDKAELKWRRKLQEKYVSIVAYHIYKEIVSDAAAIYDAGYNVGKEEGKVKNA